ncbi:MAG: hypothetical protein KAS36_02765 [Anaerolineales bacterium]|nr:hypothetical protein [Anaerolineales bacterium]
MFIPRQPVVDNQFCEYVETSTTGGVGGAVAFAGAAVYLAGNMPGYTGTNQGVESLVQVFDDSSSTTIVFGLLMQKVKTGYHEVHPAGYILKQDFGSSDAIAQAKYDTNGNIDGTQKVPVGVAHDGGIWDTTHYTSDNGTPTVVGNFAAIEAGDLLYVHKGGVSWNDGLLTSVLAQDNSAARYPIYGDEAGTGTLGAAAIVIKGVSAAKAFSTFSNQTLYPIRIKLLV